MGHIHISYPEPSIEMSEKIVKAMDLFLGVPSVLLDKDTRRKELYGKAGAFRFKPYGLEYRSLSNFWLASEALVKMVFEQVDKVLTYAKENEVIHPGSQLGQDIVSCINNNDEELAARLVKKYNIF